MGSLPLPKLELTLAILKPHIVSMPHVVKSIQNSILNNKFFFIRTKRDVMSKEQAHRFYEEHRNKFFFNRLVSFMCSGHCILHILARENAIQTWRNMMGPTKVYKSIYTHPDTIRGLYGLSDTRNAVHGSDSPESAKREIEILFPDFKMDDWFNKEEEKVRTGHVQLDKSNFVHSVV